MVVENRIVVLLTNLCFFILHKTGLRALDADLSMLGTLLDVHVYKMCHVLCMVCVLYSRES